MRPAAEQPGEAIRRVAPPAEGSAWIRCAEDAPYFTTEAGEAWMPVGHNEAVTWPRLGGLHRRRDVAPVEEHFAELAASGVNCLRLMLDYSQVPHRALEHRVGEFSPAMVRMWDDLLALGEKHAIRFLLTPFDTFFMVKRWKSHPYSRHRGGPAERLETMFTCPETRAAVINRLLFATRRWGHSPAVFAWDLWNEIDAFYAGGDLQATHDFVTEVSAALRDEEIRLHGRAHLQTVSVFHPNLVAAPELGEIIFRHPSLDFASVHLYEHGPLDAPRSSLEPAEATVRLMRNALAQTPFPRPVLDTEHGPVHSFKDRRLTLPDSFDTACFRRTQWAHLAIGGAGGGMRWPYRHPHVLLPEMHAAQKIFADFVPLIDWQRFDRQPLGDRLKVHDFKGLAVGCGNSEQAVIALMASEADGAIARQLDIMGLAPGCYDVTQVNTVTGAREACQVHTRCDGSLVVLTMGGVHDIALAVTPAPDGC
jgi:mannan endo-1,4-beta-mannosidase